MGCPSCPRFPSGRVAKSGLQDRHCEPVWRVETGYQGSCPDLPSVDGLTLRIFTGSDLVLRKSNGRKGRSSFFTEFGGERSFKYGEGEHNSWREGRIYPDSP